MSIERYTQRPYVVEAVRWDGTNDAEINNWIPGRVLCWSSDRMPCLAVDDGFGQERAEVGDWIVKGPHGFFVQRADLFADRYEPAR